VGLDAVLARVVEHPLGELAPHHLPGLRALVRLVVPEIERRRLVALRVDELHAVLLRERAGLELGQHVEPLEHPVSLGDQRLADVEGRKRLTRKMSLSPNSRSCGSLGKLRKPGEFLRQEVCDGT
jgi:hypothetical protein